MKSKMQKFSLVKKQLAPTKRKKSFKKIQEKRHKKKNTDDPEIEILNSRLWPTFDQPKEEILPADIKAFTDLPISKKTLEGLKSQNFTTPTDIQRESLMYGLKGHDILGAAKTGSGKTLAFLIPILECLFKQRYTPSFGMAALVISPTRELAYQSFDVLKKIGKFHDLSFGLVTGGMLLKEEAKKMNNTNVIICTPGRLQQHFEQTPNFTADELKILVLDEADKILHMGFAETMNAILEALPKQRQTLLFSATQTKSVKDLARLSLKKPIYVSVHEKAKETTPTTLEQRYIICEMHDKVNTLWSFIKSHKHSKILVFLSCCKQTRYLYQAFKKMHPGLTILCLHGHMKQHQRMEVYNSFSRKQHAVLLATDVAARGLDFPVINWVVQVDKPENVDTYIHRVGRTARYEKVGEALLMLLPAEEKKMVEDLVKRKIPIVKLKVSKKRIFDVTKKLESLCASDKDFKDNAQKAFISVMKTLYVLDKPCFSSVDRDAFAASLGLVQSPKLPFLEKAIKKSQAPTKDVQKESEESDSEDEDDESSEDDSEDEEGSEERSEDEEEKKAMLQQKKTLDFGLASDSEEEDNIYKVVKDVQPEGEEDQTQVNGIQEVKSGKKKSKAKEKLKLLKYTTRIMFDEEGNPEGKESEDEDVGGLNIEQAKQRMKERDKVDKELQRQRIKEQHREKRLKLKEKRRLAELEKRGEPAQEPQVVLGDPEDNDAMEEEQDDSQINEGDKSENDETDGDESGDDETGEEDDESDNNSESDEPKPKKRRLNIGGKAEDDGTDEESDVSSTKDDGSSDEEDNESGLDGLEQDEAAVLALLGKS
ncbi:probable ATP-dependent RNA helicase DDX10 [Physella acuta]|uniref:probable ATP-dependent RNA helicase DDX10 n=1 Tax=Physella acuta TaxID=109671 RepID=UPI0027DE2B1D|nr:probable ATP-dependent RNA helicase DDX10 [Physella acuta]